ncbi:unnamed protein product, partial [Pylaiella littoralis]
REGRGGGRAPGVGQGRGHPGRTFGSADEARQSIFLLPPASGDKSTTASVRLGNADNRVITSVNEERNTSSCSRQQCFGQRAGFQSQRQTSANNGGVPSLIGGVCRHGAAASLHIMKKTGKHATKVRIAGEQTFDGVKMLAEKAKAAGLVTQPEFDDVMAVIVGADRNGVWPLYETERRHFAIYDNRKRTTEQDWGCVKNDEVSPGSAPRRLTPERHLMCRVRLRRD